MPGPNAVMNDREIQKFRSEEEKEYDNMPSDGAKKLYLEGLEEYFNKNFSIFANEELSPVISSVFSSKEKEALRNKNLNYADRYEIIYKKGDDISFELNDPEEEESAEIATRVIKGMQQMGVLMGLYYKKSLEHCPCAAPLVQGRKHTLMTGGGRKKRTKKKSRRRKRRTKKRRKKKTRKKRGGYDLDPRKIYFYKRVGSNWIFKGTYIQTNGTNVLFNDWSGSQKQGENIGRIGGDGRSYTEDIRRIEKIWRFNPRAVQQDGGPGRVLPEFLSERISGFVGGKRRKKKKRKTRR